MCLIKRLEFEEFIIETEENRNMFQVHRDGT
jgi:hypothetical protein